MMLEKLSKIPYLIAAFVMLLRVQITFLLFK